MVNLISAVNAHFMLRSNQIQKIRQIKAWYYRIDLTNPLRSYNCPHPEQPYQTFHVKKENVLNYWIWQKKLEIFWCIISQKLTGMLKSKPWLAIQGFSHLIHFYWQKGATLFWDSKGSSMRLKNCKFNILSRKSDKVIYWRGRKLKCSTQDKDLAYVFETNQTFWQKITFSMTAMKNKVQTSCFWHRR